MGKSSIVILSKSHCLAFRAANSQEPLGVCNVCLSPLNKMASQVPALCCTINIDVAFPSRAFCSLAGAGVAVRNSKIWYEKFCPDTSESCMQGYTSFPAVFFAVPYPISHWTLCSFSTNMNTYNVLIHSGHLIYSCEISGSHSREYED
jgi:hypothetical protein